MTNNSNKKTTTYTILFSLFLIVVILLYSNFDIKYFQLKVAEESVEKYFIAKKNGDISGAYMEASFAAKLYLEANDKNNYEKWYNIQKQERDLLGMPNSNVNYNSVPDTAKFLPEIKIEIKANTYFGTQPSFYLKKINGEDSFMNGNKIRIASKKYKFCVKENNIVTLDLVDLENKNKTNYCGTYKVVHNGIYNTHNDLMLSLECEFIDKTNTKLIYILECFPNDYGNCFGYKQPKFAVLGLNYVEEVIDTTGPNRSFVVEKNDYGQGYYILKGKCAIHTSSDVNSKLVGYLNKETIVYVDGFYLKNANLPKYSGFINADSIYRFPCYE